jgi:hypothetical protein
MKAISRVKTLKLSFVHFDDKVTGIKIGYAFDRMKWEQI